MAITIRTDIYSTNPTISPVDGTLIDSKRKNDEHNKRHGTFNIQRGDYPERDKARDERAKARGEI